MIQIKIKDNGEPLVDLKKYCPKAIIAINKKRMAVEKAAYLRKTVAKMLNRAQKYLPNGINFIISDAWRPAYIQCKIYFKFISHFKKTRPKLNEKQIMRRVNEYVAPWKGKGASGDMSGGAIDIRLVDAKGRKIPMKSKKLNYQENSLSNQKKLPPYIQKNRQILFDAMLKAGFSNYYKEFWHWSCGDYYWAKRKKNQKLFMEPWPM